LEKDKDVHINSLVEVILNALEEKDIKEYNPQRYLKHGRRKRGRNFLISFGEIRYRLA